MRTKCIPCTPKNRLDLFQEYILRWLKLQSQVRRTIQTFPSPAPASLIGTNHKFRITCFATKHTKAILNHTHTHTHTQNVSPHVTHVRNTFFTHMRQFRKAHTIVASREKYRSFLRWRKSEWSIFFADRCFLLCSSTQNDSTGELFNYPKNAICQVNLLSVSLISGLLCNQINFF